MSSTELSPGLAELLQEVPVSGDLMQVTPEQVARGLRQGVEWARTRQTGLLPVERELLRRHREELAEVLLDACYVRLHDGSVGHKTAWSPIPTLDRARASEREWLQESRRLAELEDVRSASDVIRAASISGLAHLAQRLCPSHRALYVQGTDCALLRSQPRTALVLFQRMGELSSLPGIRSIAANNTALAHTLLGDTEAALSIVREQASRSSMATAVNLFVYGAELGREEDALEGLSCFGALAADAPTQARVLIDGRRQEIAEDKWVPSAASRTVAKKMEPKVGSWQRELLHVLV